MTASPAMSLIIAAYQRARVLELVLASLESQTFTDFEVVIADDGSGVDVEKLAKRWGERAQCAVQHVWHEDQGFRKTLIVNRAVARSAGSYLVFIDGDCILHHRFLERHHVRSRDGWVLSGRRVMFDAELTERLAVDDVTSRRIERVTTWWNHAKPHDRRNGIYAPLLFGFRGGFNPRYEILGSNFSLSRNDFLAVNGYDERIVGRGLEDVNLRTRLLNAGFVIRCIAQEALQYHCEHANDGFPHDAATVERWRETRETRTAHGVVKHPQRVG